MTTEYSKGYVYAGLLSDMRGTAVDAALSSITLDLVFGYIENHEKELPKEYLTNVDKEVWYSDLRRYETYVKQLAGKFSEAGIEVGTVRDFVILGTPIM